MTKRLKWLLIPPVVLLVLAVIGVQLLRMHALGGDAPARMALMRVAPPPAEGSNGYAWLALADYDIPAAEMDAAMAEDVKRFDASYGAGTRYDVDAAPYVSYAGEKYPARPAPAAASLVCATTQPDCLDLVRADVDAVRAGLAADAAYLDMAERSLAAGHVRNPYFSTVETPIANYKPWRIMMASVALDHLDGNSERALQRGCGLVADLRRIDSDSQSLIEKMVAQAMAESAAGLLVSIRRDQPTLALPAVCADAMGPPTDAELDICPVIRGEYQMYAHTGRKLSQQLEGWNPIKVLGRALFSSPGLMESWTAEHMAPMCSDEFRAQLKLGQLPAASPPISEDRIDCYGAYLSCMLAGMALPDLNQYAMRSLDHQASLQLLFAAQSVAAGEIPAADAVAAVTTPGYTVELDDGKKTLTMARRGFRGNPKPIVVAY